MTRFILSLVLFAFLLNYGCTSALDWMDRRVAECNDRGDC